jgi:hypothetical protein
MSSNNIIPFPFYMGFLRATGPFHKIDAEEVTKFLDQKRPFRSVLSSQKNCIHLKFKILVKLFLNYVKMFAKKWALELKRIFQSLFFETLSIKTTLTCLKFNIS